MMKWYIANTVDLMVTKIIHKLLNPYKVLQLFLDIVATPIFNIILCIMMNLSWNIFNCAIKNHSYSI